MKTTLLMAAALLGSLLVFAAPAQAGGPPQMCIDAYRPCIDPDGPLLGCEHPVSDPIGWAQCREPPVLGCRGLLEDDVAWRDCIGDKIPNPTIICSPIRPVDEWADCAVTKIGQMIEHPYCQVDCELMQCLIRVIQDADEGITIPPHQC